MAAGSEAVEAVERQLLAAVCMNIDAAWALLVSVAAAAEPASVLASALVARPAAALGSQSSPGFTSACFPLASAWRSPSGCLSATAFAA